MMRQHDPDFLPSGRISVFGHEFIKGARRLLPNGQSGIYIVNGDGSIDTPITDTLGEMNFAEHLQGVADHIGPETLMVEETNTGRISRTDANGGGWIYDNHESERSGMFSWRRDIPTDALSDGVPERCSAG